MEEMSAFELEREEQIRKNNKLLMEIGLPQVVERIASNERERKRKQALRGARLPTRRVRTRRNPVPVRQSNRLKGKAAPVYNENVCSVASPTAANKVHRPLGFMASTEREVYTVAQFESLGTFKEEWEPRTDGYLHGNRVYSDAGSTCHQCRQKTLGKRSACSRCKSYYGIFCGDCLWMRYGENLNELTKDWNCPTCRGFCNCSRCRNDRGWAPTGQMYARAKAEGYPSVAHYIVSTHLEKCDKSVKRRSTRLAVKTKSK